MKKRFIIIPVVLLLAYFVPVTKKTKNYRVYAGRFCEYYDFTTFDSKLISASGMSSYAKTYSKNPSRHRYLSVSYWKTIYGKVMLVSGEIMDE